MKQCTANRSFTTAGLTYKSERLAFLNGKRNIIHRFQWFAPEKTDVDIKVLFQVLDLDDRGIAVITHSVSPPFFFDCIF